MLSFQLQGRQLLVGHLDKDMVQQIVPRFLHVLAEALAEVVQRPQFKRHGADVLQNQRDESFCRRAARRGNHAVPNEGSWSASRVPMQQNGPPHRWVKQAGWLPRCRRWVLVDVASPPRPSMRVSPRW